jgi:hypothetical protein
MALLTFIFYNFFSIEEIEDKIVAIGEVFTYLWEPYTISLNSLWTCNNDDHDFNITNVEVRIPCIL